MLGHILIIAYFSVVGLATSVSDCPLRLTRDRYLRTHGAFCYKFMINERRSFDDAQRYCQQDGGNLAMVKSKSVDKYLRYSLKHNYAVYYGHVWIGLRSKANEFGWVDGSKMEYNDLNSDRAGTTDEECVAMAAADELWSTYRCDSWTMFEEKNNFICEYLVGNISKAESNEGCPFQSNNGDDLKSIGNKCYYFGVKEQLPYQNAEKYCEKYGGTLAMIKSKKINDFLHYHLSVTQDLHYDSESLWIGLKYTGLPRVLQWVDGTSLQYSNIGDVFATSYRDCLTISPSDGKWRAHYCKDSSIDARHFICEFDKNKTTVRSTVAPSLQPRRTTNNLILPTIPVPATKDDCRVSADSEDNIRVFKDKCYYFAIKEILTFKKADEFCKSHGGTLASVKSERVNYFLQKYLDKLDDDNIFIKNFWIGLTLRKADNTYHWADGAMLGFRNFKYSYATGECVNMSPLDGKWTTSSNCLSHPLYKGDENHFICEFKSASSEPTKPTTNGAFSTQPPPLLSGCPTEHFNENDIKLFENKCFYFGVHERVSFYNAARICEHYGGELALIKSKSINDFLEHHLHQTYKLGYLSNPLWIGLRFSKVRDEYYWLDGMKMNFSNFRHKTAYGECVAMSPSDGSWEDFYCAARTDVETDKHNYICQFDKAIQTTAIPTINGNTASQDANRTGSTAKPSSMGSANSTTMASMLTTFVNMDWMGNGTDSTAVAPTSDDASSPTAAGLKT